MCEKFLLLLAAVCYVGLNAGEPIVPVPEETFQQKLIRLAHMIEDSPVLKAQFMDRVAAQSNLTLPPIEFTCLADPSPSVPTSVHQLRPSDIKVIGAFGDSISAGNGLGAANAPAVAVENRGEVFTIGGDETLDVGVITLVNFLRKFNPDIKGYSHCPSTRDNLERSWLNVAEPGGDNRDMPPQANDIVERMMNDARIDYVNDWKLISLFVGGNDLCASCRRTEYTPENYGAKFREAMDILYANVPRAMVQLIAMFDVTPLSNFSNSLLCNALQINFCDCAVNETTRAQLRNTQLGYFDQLQAIANDPIYKQRQDFTIVLQPNMRDMQPPIDPNTGKYLDGFLAPDCFHPNRVAHQSFAYFLWNTMLTPVGYKPLASDIPVDSNEPLVAMCPTAAHPYIFTNENSVGVIWP
jgi:phospholipase B1